MADTKKEVNCKKSDQIPRKRSAVWVTMKKVKTKLSLTDKEATPVNWKVVWLVFLSLFSSSFNLTFLFPFLPEMILSFGYNEEDKGYYAGIVASSMFAGRVFGCYFWGWLSDKKGRKPVIMITLLLNGICSLVFGFTTNIWMAVITRFLTGLVNGTVGTCKTVLYEISDNTNQAVGMSITSVAWGGGIIVGPAIGGYLAAPTKQYPGVFPSEGFFHQFPYIFPGLCAFIICIIAVIIDFIWLPETLEMKQQQADEGETAELDELTEDLEISSKFLTKNQVEHQMSKGPSAALSVEDLHMESDAATYLAQTDKEIHITSHGFVIEDATDSNMVHRRHSDDEHISINDSEEETQFFVEQSSEQTNVKINPQAESPLFVEEVDRSSVIEDTVTTSHDNEHCVAREEASVGDSTDPTACSLCKTLKKWSVIRLLGQFDVFIACTLYSVFSFALIGFDELFTVWAATETRLDGLGFQPNHIGTVLGASSIPLLFLQLFLFPLAARKFEIKTIYMFITACMMILMTSMPSLHLLVDRPVILWVLLLCLTALLRLLTSFVFSCTGLFINNSVVASEAGSVNGLAMTTTAITRTFAPLVGGSVYAWTVGYASDNLGPPFDVSFTFFIFGFTMFIVCLLVVIVPDHLNRQKK